MLPIIIALAFAGIQTASAHQEKAIRVVGKLPAKASCFICLQNGETELEKPAGAVTYKGRTYYFCNKGEVDAFIKDPESFIPAPLPRPAPAFSLPTAAGGPLSFESIKGKVTLVDFWATWCGPCVKAMPAVQKLHETYAPKGLSVIGISIDEEGAKKVGPFLSKSKVKYTYPIALDNADVWKAWGVRSLPTMVLVSDGQIVKHWSGAVDLKDVERAIRDALLR
ncbi:MAG: redoxin family protein [Armatimonadaceae bacterium]